MRYINKNSELAQRFWETGRLDDCPIYDFHGHMHEMYGGYLPIDTPEKQYASLMQSGVKSFVFCSHLSLYCAELGECMNLGPVKQFGRPLRAYLGVQSYNLDFERDRKLFEENPDVYVGFKFLVDYFHVPLDADCHRPYWEYLNEHHLLALCHTWGGSLFNGPANVQAVAERYPNVTLILGHSLHDQWDEAIRIAKAFPNVYLELTAVLDDRGILERFVREVGSERILFGTDLPWFSTFHGIGCVLDAEMTDDDRRNIFYRNGERILSRFEK